MRMKQHIQNQLRKAFLQKAQTQSQAQAGVSLLEVLLLLTLMSLTILPFTIMVSQTAQTGRGAYLQSSRSILLNSLADETTDERSLYATAYSTVSMQSANTESGQVLPWRSMVDKTTDATDTFQKTIYFYLYNNSTDAANAPRYKTKYVRNRSTARFHFSAANNAFTDSSGFWWQGWTTYDAINRVPGRNSANGVTGTLADAVFNLPGHRDAKIYQDFWYTAGGPTIFSAPVANGLYTVKLYFSDNVAATRTLDIRIEGTLMNPDAPYNPALYCGNQLSCGNVQMFDVMVSDNVLDIQLDANVNSSSTVAAIRSLSIKKRTE